jgi:hypothetical protein
VNADEALRRAWEIGTEDATDEVMDEYERLLPVLVEAGYAVDLGHTWRYTKKGIERVGQLGPDADVEEPITRDDFTSDLRKVARPDE